jgi:hypothetical protein
MNYSPLPEAIPSRESRTRALLRSMIAALDDGDEATYFACFELLQSVTLEMLSTEPTP